MLHRAKLTCQLWALLSAGAPLVLLDVGNKGVGNLLVDTQPHTQPNAAVVLGYKNFDGLKADDQRGNRAQLALAVTGSVPLLVLMTAAQIADALPRELWREHGFLLVLSICLSTAQSVLALMELVKWRHFDCKARNEPGWAIC